MYLLGWVADYHDPQDFIDLLFRSDSPENHLGHANPTVDSLVKQAQSEKDAAKRVESYQQAEQIIR